MNWKYLRLHEFDAKSLYEVLKLRVNVFIIEQACFYHELDDKDYYATHVMAYDSDNRLVGYLRIVDPGISYDELSIGRIVVAPEVRGEGYGRDLVTEGLTYIKEVHGPVPVRISAQAYLEKFYESFGFQAVSDVYLEDEIPHIEMLLE